MMMPQPNDSDGGLVKYGVVLCTRCHSAETELVYLITPDEQNGDQVHGTYRCRKCGRAFSIIEL
jgi:hypothetical protein